MSINQFSYENDPNEDYPNETLDKARLHIFQQLLLRYGKTIKTMDEHNPHHAVNVGINIDAERKCTFNLVAQLPEKHSSRPYPPFGHKIESISEAIQFDDGIALSIILSLGYEHRKALADMLIPLATDHIRMELDAQHAWKDEEKTLQKLSELETMLLSGKKDSLNEAHPEDGSSKDIYECMPENPAEEITAAATEHVLRRIRRLLRQNQPKNEQWIKRIRSDNSDFCFSYGYGEKIRIWLQSVDNHEERSKDIDFENRKLWRVNPWVVSEAFDSMQKGDPAVYRYVLATSFIHRLVAMKRSQEECPESFRQLAFSEEERILISRISFMDISSLYDRMLNRTLSK